MIVKMLTDDVFSDSFACDQQLFQNVIKPKKIKGMFALLAWKSGELVGQSFPTFFFFF